MEKRRQFVLENSVCFVCMVHGIIWQNIVIPIFSVKFVNEITIIYYISMVGIPQQLSAI